MKPLAPCSGGHSKPFVNNDGIIWHHGIRNERIGQGVCTLQLYALLESRPIREATLINFYKSCLIILAMYDVSLEGPRESDRQQVLVLSWFSTACLVASISHTDGRSERE
ncbi:hypothetical protein EVAR_84657_1 [Eumeta japonica]|uniref:Uncharacterized protein n=1 Tax=Eumeta variegata TaxID=151549 RepID=A0A4C1UYK5_EUMVA|nr:hypothetical protein EVAR_84657_1 [Eumeta japonica]